MSDQGFDPEIEGFLFESAEIERRRAAQLTEAEHLRLLEEDVRTGMSDSTRVDERADRDRPMRQAELDERRRQFEAGDL
jgi:hypothetical protein